MYSQHDEERIILEYFGNQKGRFLDIGAYNGITFSNTRKLSELGWSGVCIEPDPISFSKLMEVYDGNPNVQLVNMAISDKWELLKFYESRGDAVSTCNKNNVQIWSKAGTKFRIIYVASSSIRTVLSAFPGNFDFINLDIEGMSWMVLSTLPLGEMNTRLLCVETDNYEEDIVRYCSKFGFSRLHRTDENILLKQ